MREQTRLFLIVRILLVNSRHYLAGGDSRYTFDLAHLLTAKSHEVAFFAMQDKLNVPDPNADLFVSHLDFRGMLRMKTPRNCLRVFCRAIYSREARQKFSRLLDRFRPDLVHLQNLHGHITPAVVFEAKRRRLPVVWTLHDYKLICPNSHFLADPTGQVCEACGRTRFYQAVLRRCKKGSLAASALACLEIATHRLTGVNRRVDVFIAPSQFIHRKFLDRGFPPGQMAQVPYLLPEAAYRTAARAGQAPARPYILFLGKLELLKGLRELILACRSGRASMSFWRGVRTASERNFLRIGGEYPMGWPPGWRRIASALGQGDRLGPPLHLVRKPTSMHSRGLRAGQTRHHLETRGNGRVGRRRRPKGSAGPAARPHGAW